MKKILFISIIFVFLFACSSEETTETNNNLKEEIEIVNEENNAEEELVVETVKDKSTEILEKSEDINNKLDDLLEGL